MSNDCLSKETNAILLTLRSRSNFSEMSKQKRFHLSARERHVLMNVLHPSLLKSFALRAFAAGILWKTEPWDFLHDYLQPNASHVQPLSFWKMITVFRSSNWNFSSPHYVTCFICQSLQIFTEKGTSTITWKSINFCGLKIEIFISDGGKIYEFFQKIC